MSGQTLLMVLVIAAIAAAAWWFSSKRRKELATWAASNGLRMVAGHDRSIDNAYPSFSCLHRGHSRRASNIMQGPWNGRDLLAFDFHYVTGHGKDRTTHTFSAIVLQSSVPLKPLSIRPENVFDKVTEFFGVDDIDFESAQFSREFHVKSPDKRWAYDVLHQRTMEFLLNRGKFSIQFDNQHAIVWRNRRFNTQIFQEAIETIEGIYDRIPEYLARQQSGESRQ